MPAWMPRSRRNGSRIKIFRVVFPILLLTLIGLVAWRYAVPLLKAIEKKHSSKQSSPKNSPAFRPTGAAIDSIFTKTFADLSLQKIPIEEAMVDSSGRKRRYPSFRTYWPKAYPFEWFTLRLQANCHQFDSLYYDALEFNNGKGLMAILADNRDTLGLLILTASDRPVAPAFSMAFILDGFSRLKTNEVRALTALQIPFGYVCQADQIPDKIMAQILKASKGQGILNIPTDVNSWELILRVKLHGKQLQKSSINQKAVSEILGQFPHLQGFYLDKTRGVDRDVMKILTSELTKRNMVYLYEKGLPDFADSTIYANGLNLASFAVSTDCREATIDKFRELIMAKSNILTSEDKGIFLLNSTPESIALLKSACSILEKSAIEIVAPLAKAKPVEKL